MVKTLTTLIDFFFRIDTAHALQAATANSKKAGTVDPCSLHFLGNMIVLCVWIASNIQIIVEARNYDQVIREGGVHAQIGIQMTLMTSKSL